MTERAQAEAWQRVVDRNRDVQAPIARFNLTLLESLRPRWESRVRADTSMFEVLFTRPGSTGYRYDERVEVTWESQDRVRVALRRMVPRRGATHPAGPVVITGDLVRPENAIPVVESFLMQLAADDA